MTRRALFLLIGDLAAMICLTVAVWLTFMFAAAMLPEQESMHSEAGYRRAGQ